MRLFNSTHKKLAGSLVAGSALVMLTSATALAGFAPANRPTFTWANPATYVTFDSITDNPVVGDERPFLSARDINSSTNLDDVTVHDGEELVLQIYFHNNASSNLNLVAHNTKVFVALPQAPATANYASGAITSTNANPAVVTDTVDFNGAHPYTMSYEAGSAQLWTNALNGVALNDSIVTSSGALIGYNAINGDVPGCAQYSGYVTLKVKVSMPTTPTPTPTPTPKPTPTPTPPKALPNTGPGNVAEIFAGASTIGAAGRYAVLRRRRS